jgi:predicted esterase
VHRNPRPIAVLWGMSKQSAPLNVQTPGRSLPGRARATPSRAEDPMIEKEKTILMFAMAFVLNFAFAAGAFALNYSGSQGNPATFETLEETRASSPAAVAALETNQGKSFKSHPVLDGYPQGTTYVYRSPNLFGGRSAARLNTDILVFAEKSFTNKDAALKFLKDLGLIDIINQAIGSVILITPADAKAGFTSNDQKFYYALQTAIFAQKANERNGNQAAYYSDAEYFGGFGYTYVIGIDGGATFLNNYIAGIIDYVSRIAGMLLINGKMENIRQVAAFVPVFLVNAPDAVIEKYKRANDVNASTISGGIETWFNQALPLKKVAIARNGNTETANYIKDAYYNMFIKAMRAPVLKPGLYSASTPYQNNGLDQAPYSLCNRNAVINGVTKDGIHLIRRTEEIFKDVKTIDGEYLQTWFEYLPEEVLKNTAPAGTVPLVLAMHGSGDDPRSFTDEIGLLALAGSERFAVIAPEHQYIFWTQQGNKYVEGIECTILPRFIKYILKTYRALDPSRVYVTGYSMGGYATFKAVNGDPSVFAAAVPMAGMGYTGTPEQTSQFSKFHLPIMFTTSTYDLNGPFDPNNGTIGSSFKTQIPLFLGYNGMKKFESFDFDAYPVAGFKADRIENLRLNNEYNNTTWYISNADGIPMIALSVTEGLVHALYPEYAKIMWNFARHYSRNQQTGAINYNPYIK